MIYRTSRERIIEYFNTDGISQSDIKLFDKGLDYYLENQIIKVKDKYFDEQPKHIRIGSAVDCMITEGIDVFNKIYYISVLEKKPSDTVISIINEVFDNAHNLQEGEQFSPVLETHREKIIESCVSHEYQPRYGDDAKVNAIVREGEAYWTELTMANGREVITVEEMQLIDRVATSLLNHPEVKDILSEAEFGSGTDVLFQFPFYYVNKSTMMVSKVLIDMMVVDHMAETIKLYDFKTMWDTVTNFPYHSKKRRYDIQAAYYYDSIARNRDKLSKAIISNYNIVESVESSSTELAEASVQPFRELSNYTVSSFCFIVQSTTFNNNPVIFKVSDSLLTLARKGRPRLYSPVVAKGSGSTSSSKIEQIEYEPINGYETMLDNYADFRIKSQNDESVFKHPDKLTYNWYGII